MSVAPEIRIVGKRAVLRQGRAELMEVGVNELFAEILRAAEKPPSCEVYPKGVRLWLDRGTGTGVVVEISPHARTVRWLAEGSKAPFGRGARYENRYLAFPFVILLLVFRDGALTGFQQLYYRTASLEKGEYLSLPNLYNVAEAYGQRCWLCLANLRDVSGLDWSKRIDAILGHVFSAAFNRSSEVHEGNSYFTAMRGIDPRIKTIEAWEEATRENPLFVLDVPWKPAGVTARAELLAMLDKVVAPASFGSATDLCRLITTASARRSVP